MFHKDFTFRNFFLSSFFHYFLMRKPSNGTSPPEKAVSYYECPTIQDPGRKTETTLGFSSIEQKHLDTQMMGGLIRRGIPEVRNIRKLFSHL